LTSEGFDITPVCAGYDIDLMI